MSKINVVDMAGKVVSELELNDAVFGIEPNKTAMHSAVVNYLANQRQGTQSTLTRTEVRGGGKKPWRQKGTGHARQGSTRAPQETRRHRAGSEAPFLQIFAEQEGKTAGYQVGAVEQGSRE